MRCSPLQRRQRGFTLMEVMVAIALLAVVSGMSWRGLDGMVRAHEAIRQQAQGLSVVQTSMAQWHTDLNHLAELPHLRPLEWDGKVLRLSRFAPRALASEASALQVVAWSDRNIGGQRHWVRWQSEPLHSRQQWQAAWERAREWAYAGGLTTSPREVVLLPMTQWEIFYAREGRWVNPQSSSQVQTDTGDTSGDTTGSQPQTTSTQEAAVPDSIRLRIQLAPGQAISGWLVRDWLNPQQGAARL
ncbi:general secretion pathway protein J [Lampropedia hyalina DSM 16112]|jgi:general secretion pathway protein J|uniref:General secretion pathway protein J n=1 Tax=Lampropedia hyalina DSM 16112 TaxID=1122156 RepID=A0A1M5DZ52_9BURK|nr:prepilin-type N-terminal cleavage/methylation domain-containing protein [Lampropedia hyalina]SHF72154.1 general secretion pathway protein J [Lampropedia hyalina DSM 16112]